MCRLQQGIGVDPGSQWWNKVSGEPRSQGRALVNAVDSTFTDTQAEAQSNYLAREAIVRHRGSIFRDCRGLGLIFARIVIRSIKGVEVAMQVHDCEITCVLTGVRVSIRSAQDFHTTRWLIVALLALTFERGEKLPSIVRNEVRGS